MGRKCVSEKILPKGRILYFNEEEHKYTYDLGNGYISVTTLIGKYTQEFKKEEKSEKVLEVREEVVEEVPQAVPTLPKTGSVASASWMGVILLAIGAFLRRFKRR